MPRHHREKRDMYDKTEIFGDGYNRSSLAHKLVFLFNVILKIPSSQNPGFFSKENSVVSSIKNKIERERRFSLTKTE
jgi:hypothetical protein